MKKLTAIILVLIIMLSSISVCAVNPQTGKYIFLSLGDSIAQGAGLTDRKTQVYGAIVSSKRNYEFINDAVGGYTSADLLKQLTDIKNAHYCASDVAKADIICISIGGNDILKDKDISAAFLSKDYVTMYTAFLEKSSAILAELKSNIAKIVTRIKELNPKAVVLVQNLYNPIFASETLRFFGSAGIIAINNAISSAGGGTYYVPDVNAVFNDASMMSSDMIHPSAAGHKAIAEAVDKCLSGISGVPSGGTTGTDTDVGASIIQILTSFIKILINVINTIISLVNTAA